ncbi:hypothetical protein V495_03284, partial [Pseudogymnoascus sp. VKM F-4514 (FW-929)]
MDRASQALAQGVPPGVPDSYRALADHGNVPRSTLNYRARGRRSIEEKAQSQQYLKPWEEDVVVKFFAMPVREWYQADRDNGSQSKRAAACWSPPGDTPQFSAAKCHHAGVLARSQHTAGHHPMIPVVDHTPQFFAAKCHHA